MSAGSVGAPNGVIGEHTKTDRDKGTEDADPRQFVNLGGPERNV